MRFRPNRDRRGAAAVELAVMLPFLMFLLVIGADWARLLYYKIEVDGAARAGALWAADVATRPESPYPTLRAAVLAASPNLPSTIPDPTLATATVSGRTVYRVTVTMEFKTLTSFSLVNFAVPKTTTITRMVEMRELPASTS